ncbi:hypothetical protein EYF80_010202 [Liparis tanakae]|uniref:Uncharacterized protein n=1 Tax=Liparis tanakae TaxID=230148 RepID=A0A4Z2INI0_9TELE|nr:hypothetical protein EYF80_010202 [Liparis tanakae]
MSTSGQDLAGGQFMIEGVEHFQNELQDVRQLLLHQRQTNPLRLQHLQLHLKQLSLLCLLLQLLHQRSHGARPRPQSDAGRKRRQDAVQRQQFHVNASSGPVAEGAVSRPPPTGRRDGRSVVVSTWSMSISAWLSFSSSCLCNLATLSRSSTTALQLSSLLELP